jgi:signal transduction histidine kinase
LTDLASHAGLVLRNVRLIEELRESRRRIVAGQDARAKKLERDIHDGAQQHLVALAVRFRLARSLAGRDPEKARAMLEELRADVRQTAEALRDLARGLFPAVLADKGLAAALQAEAVRSPVPVTVEAASLQRYPSEAEAAVYFAVLEALQNAAKYSAATGVTVRLTDADGVLAFSVSDDGRGFDPKMTGTGSGLEGMADRLAAAGGDLSVRSSPGHGTTVAGRLPIERVKG